jgi:hypothetical protein
MTVLIYVDAEWTEIDVLPGNPGGLNKIRLVVRVVNGDFEAKLLQMH